MIEVLKQALEALEQWNTPLYKRGTVIETLRQAIAELESQEPVPTIEDLEQEIYQNTRNFVSLDVMEWMLKRYYTRPPQRTEQEQPLPPVEIGVDVTADGASVVAFYRRPNAVMEMFYSQFHPAPQRPWVELTDGEVTEGLCRTRYALQTATAWVDGVEWAAKQLKEKNT